MYGDYNRDQWQSFEAVRRVLEALSGEERALLEGMIRPYMDFRNRLDAFTHRRFESFCRKTCFDEGPAACCGFESIFTFFADQVVTLLHSNSEALRAIFRVLERPNRNRHCVYLGKAGCLWKVRPIGCALFFCDQAKAAVFERRPEALSDWESFRREEKEYTWPSKPVLFDELETFFMLRGADSPHLYFHRSPGLLRVKKRAGLPVHQTFFCETSRAKCSKDRS